MAALLAVSALLGGCKDISTIAGIAGGSATAAATGSPAIGIAVGIGVSAGGNFLVRYIARVRAGAEQDVIAETAGALPPGDEGAWAIHRTIPIGNEHGNLWVIDTINTPIAICKEVVFSVINGAPCSAEPVHVGCLSRPEGVEMGHRGTGCRAVGFSAIAACSEIPGYQCGLAQAAPLFRYAFECFLPTRIGPSSQHTQSGREVSMSVLCKLFH